MSEEEQWRAEFAERGLEAVLEDLLTGRLQPRRKADFAWHWLDHQEREKGVDRRAAAETAARAVERRRRRRTALFLFVAGALALGAAALLLR